MCGIGEQEVQIVTEWVQLHQIMKSILFVNLRVEHKSGLAHGKPIMLHSSQLPCPGKVSDTLLKDLLRSYQSCNPEPSVLIVSELQDSPWNNGFSTWWSTRMG